MDQFRKFYIDFGDRLFGYFVRKTGNQSLAADLVQETFARYLERYGNREQSPALLFTIGRNLFYDDMRQKKNFTYSNLSYPESFADQEEKYIAREESQKIIDAMQQLGDNDRDILALLLSTGLTYQEMADIRECTVATIKVKVHRARKKLQKILLEDDIELLLNFTFSRQQD